MVDLGLHTGGIEPQLASLRHPGLPGQLDHMVIELMECFRLQRVGPADQGGIVGGRFPEQAREPAQHQALVYPIFGFLITPAEQVLEQQHARASLPPGWNAVHAPASADAVCQSRGAPDRTPRHHRATDPVAAAPGQSVGSSSARAQRSLLWGSDPSACANTSLRLFLLLPLFYHLSRFFSHGHLSLPGSYGLKRLHRLHFAPQTSTTAALKQPSELRAV